jgi:hypothetical protein
MEPLRMTRQSAPLCLNLIRTGEADTFMRAAFAIASQWPLIL